MKVWRICREQHGATAFSGEGARVMGGRWNSPGIAMVYASWCLSLAALEVFVNLDPGNPPKDLVWISADVPVEEQGEHRDDAAFRSTLPRSWRQYDDRETQRFGDRWAESRESLGLVVPSVVIEGDWNVLLNPLHLDAKKIRILETKPFRFDERMFR